MADVILRDRNGIPVEFEGVGAVELETDTGEPARFVMGGGDHIVSYMSDDGSEQLYYRPIMHGDSRGDVIALGLMDTPTKETTETEEHTFLGWAATIGGAVETAMFENVTEDLTVYAVFKTVLIEASGTCGEAATWKLDGEGVLTVSGEGAMTNYTTSARPPWYDYVSTIKTISIKTGLTTIGNYAFQNCTALTTVVLPDSLTSVGNYAFQNCTALTSITIPNGLTTIGNYAFQNCTALTTVVLPDSLTSVGNYAFSDCTALTSITIPNGLTTIGNYAFQNCTSLTAINVETDNTSYCSINGILYSADMTSIIRYPSKKSGTSFAIPSGVTLIDIGAFEGCASLTSVTIPNGVTKIRGYAFNGCSGLTRITIPSSVVYIGTDAFAGTSLTSATFAVTTGWSVWMADVIKLGDLTSSNLANTSTAATYLKTTYAAMTTWQRS